MRKVPTVPRLCKRVEVRIFSRITLGKTVPAVLSPRLPTPRARATLAPPTVHLRRRNRRSELEPDRVKDARTGKPYLVTIHAPHDQHHTFAMGPGDAVGVGTIRIDIDPDGHIHASPDEVAKQEAIPN